MKTQLKSHHWNDINGNPAGGGTFGIGFAISWQHGPLGRGSRRREPNGAFVEDIIRAAVDRLEFYQRGRFKCEENARAIARLKEAIAILDARTRDRTARNVEGTHVA